MSVKRLRINNLASFVDFRTDDELEKYNLVYGNNGAGKSTISNLMLLLDDSRRKPSPEGAELCKEFLRSRKSKESGSEDVRVEIEFDSGIETISYSSATGKVSVSGAAWTPIKVFNDEYTIRTMGQDIRIAMSTGVTIGQTNRELEKDRNARAGLLKERQAHAEKIVEIVERTEKEYSETADSNADVSDAICLENMLAKQTQYVENFDCVEQRKKLGYGKVSRGIDKLDVAQVKMRVNIEEIEALCLEESQPPNISTDDEKLLKDYTSFFTTGVKLYEESPNRVCPFCFRPWSTGDGPVAKYKQYLESTYSKKRQSVEDLKSKLEAYKEQVVAQHAIVESKRKQALTEGEKYEIPIDGWKDLDYDHKSHDAAIALFEKKLSSMEQAVSVRDTLVKLQEAHTDCLENNNQIICDLIKAADGVTTARKELNKVIKEHYAARSWAECSDHRNTIEVIDARVVEMDSRIERLEVNSPPADVIRAVFNGLLDIMALDDYMLGEDRKLQLCVDKNYDISIEGVRISSAQRKLLSLCYFFAELVSEVKSVHELKKYTLVFDDPVDSADYVYFYSIATVIERIEAILAKMLEVKSIKIGQFIVLTHNSLLFERLTAKWAEWSKSLRKEQSRSVLAVADKSINNYKEYISEICKYYNNPAKQRRRMIYIGNLIRRVLEILASFDSLGNNNIQTLLDGMGKQKLSLIANHLSHESFTRVLNPLSTPEELKDACGELLEVIKERHRWQYDTIVTKYNVATTELEDTP